MRRIVNIIALAVLIGNVISVQAASVKSPAQVSSAQSPLVGAWRMTLFETGQEGNMKSVPYSGQLIVTNAGTLSAQAMNPDTLAPDTPYTKSGYEALYGKIKINDASGQFTVRVDSSLTRDLIGKEMIRSFQVTGDKLVLSPVDKKEGWRVTYQRY